MDLVLLANPAARAGTAGRTADEAAGLLRARGMRVTQVSGGSATESRALVAAAVDAGVDAVAVCGGDGTVALTLPLLAGTGIPLGIIPAGTGNDIAASAGVRARDAASAVAAIAGGRTRRLDLAVVTTADGDEVPFATVLACGFDARVNDRANAMRWPRGNSRYTLAILREFLTLAATDFDLGIEHPDGTREHRRERLIMATVANGSTYGGGIPICPVADDADGMLDLVLVSELGRLRLLRLLPRLYAGTHLSVPEVRTQRVRSVTITTTGARGYADGDPVGVPPFEVTVRPGALELFVAP
ncbi:diacylglycerol kinase family protein [Microbacterium aureliae]